MQLNFFSIFAFASFFTATFTVTANLTCAIELGNTPTFLDYYIDGTSTHALPGSVVLARRTYNKSASPPVDRFTASLPRWFYFNDTQYSLSMDNSFERLGPTNESVLTIGGISTGINISGF
ncbi:hypothetical protein DFH06DRAFT_1448019 [Mycena polygramma]|nr:hypothetical protein DFH06DRAFT_1448019 [Mycena polygramma]